jgi:DUF1365 family protein
MLTPRLYRTEIAHTRLSPIRHEFRYRGYSWHIDVDDVPKLPLWLRPFAGFHAKDHFTGCPQDSLRARVDACLAAHGFEPPGGAVTALVQARVLGYVFNPLSLYWCHDKEGRVRQIIAEVHNTYGGRHAYPFQPDDKGGATLAKEFYVSPFNPVDGQYSIRAPEPDTDLDVSVVLRRAGAAVFVATMRGKALPATAGRLARLQLAAPLAPLAGSLRIRRQGIMLWLRGMKVVPR